jgi:hypothetical protein
MVVRGFKILLRELLFIMLVAVVLAMKLLRQVQAVLAVAVTEDKTRLGLLVLLIWAAGAAVLVAREHI